MVTICAGKNDRYRMDWCEIYGVDFALLDKMGYSPETGEFFTFMVEHELFDLESKPGKRPGGYCTSLPMYKAPFIFSNFNGTAADMGVLTHEAGHAFEG